MYLYDLIAQNRELLKLFYTVIIGLICFIIVLKTDKLFRISTHQGIRYFRNAFLFYGLAFIMRYLLGSIYLVSFRSELQIAIIKIIFEFFFIMAGFSLLYSLIWKKFESPEGSFSSLFNWRMVLFYGIALISAILDYVWCGYLFMFVLQIFLFGCASIIGYLNYKKSKEKGFLEIYFILMILNLFAWIVNFLVATFFSWRPEGVIGVYLINIIIFLLFLYGIVSVTKKEKRE